jgi:hypothetical protein
LKGQNNHLTLLKQSHSQLVSTITIRSDLTQLINFQSNLALRDVSGKITFWNNNKLFSTDIADFKE